LLALAQVVLNSRRPVSGEDRELEPESTHSGFSGWTLFWVALPILLGILIPARPLGADALPQRGFGAPLSARDRGQGVVLPADSSRWDILDWVQSVEDPALSAGLTGKPADIIGFVYHDPRLADGQFLAARYTLTCCVADAFAIGIAVEWDRGQPLADNTWVHIQGPVDIIEIDGQPMARIQASSIEEIPIPDQPYIIP